MLTATRAFVGAPKHDRCKGRRLAVSFSTARRSVTLRGYVRWPRHFPNGCPKADAVPADGVVWRLVRTRIPDAEDFRSWHDLRPQKDWKEKACEACGLSVFRDI